MRSSVSKSIAFVLAASTIGIYINDTPIQVRGIRGTATDTLRY